MGRVAEILFKEGNEVCGSEEIKEKLSVQKDVGKAAWAAKSKAEETKGLPTEEMFVSAMTTGFTSDLAVKVKINESLAMPEEKMAVGRQHRMLTFPMALIALLAFARHIGHTADDLFRLSKACAMGPTDPASPPDPAGARPGTSFYS